MKNVTLSIEERVLAAARRYAAARNATVNALVREFLGGIAKRQTQAAQARQRLKQLSRSSRARIGRVSWTRDDLHAR